MLEDTYGLVLCKHWNMEWRIETTGKLVEMSRNES